MPWKETCTMNASETFMNARLEPDRNMIRLCQRFGISTKTGCRWLNRYKKARSPGLVNPIREDFNGVRTHHGKVVLPVHWSLIGPRPG